jgi:phage-related protein
MIRTGITFNDIHSYKDLNLVLSEVDIPPAKPKTTYIDIPGADGALDVSEAHGDIKFSDRECTFVFTMLPTDSMTWETKKTEVSNLLNGKQMRIVLDKDDNYYYTGRCTVDGYDVDGKIRQIEVKARVNPYKFKLDKTTVTVNLTSDAQMVYLVNSRKVVSPTIYCTNANTSITFNGASYKLNAGTHKVLDIRLVEGVNPLSASGSGAVTFTYQEADL